MSTDGAKPLRSLAAMVLDDAPARAAAGSGPAAPAGQRLRAAVVWFAIAAAIVVAWWRSAQVIWRLGWFPFWQYRELGLYDRFTGGEGYFTHGPLVPIVSAFMIVMLVRHTRIALRPRPGFGLPLLGLSLLVYLFGIVAETNLIRWYAFIGVLCSAVLALWGFGALRRLWFPLAFLAFMIPFSDWLIADLALGLKMRAAAWGVRLANASGVLAESSGSRLFLTGDKSMVVGEVCSGLRTLISLLAFGALYAYVCKLPGLWRAVLFAMTVPVAVVANTLRIFLLIIVAHVSTVEIATGWFHDLTGPLIFAVAFLMMFGLERLILALHRVIRRPIRVQGLFARERLGRGEPSQARAMFLAGGRGAGIAVAVLIGATAAVGLLWLRPLAAPAVTRQLAADALPAQFELSGRPYTAQDLVLDERTSRLLGSPDYVYRRYTSASVTVDLCVVFGKGGRDNLHPPEVCLRGDGNELGQTGDVVLTGVGADGRAACRELVVESGASRTYYLYTFRSAGGYSAYYGQQQLAAFLDRILQRGRGAALVRISSPVDTSVDAARKRCMDMMRQTIPCLDQALP